MGQPDVVGEMRARIRRHFVWSLGGVVAAVLTGGAIAGGLMEVVPAGAKPIIGMISVLPMLGAVAFGWYSTFRNLRCPACSGSVWMQVSWRMSIFGSRRDDCQHCGARIFGPAGSTGRWIFIAIMVAAGAGGAIASVLLGAR